MMPVTLTDDEAYAAFLILDTVARYRKGTDRAINHLRERLLPVYHDWHTANPSKVHPSLGVPVRA